MEKLVNISQSVAVLIDGNNIEFSIHSDAEKMYKNLWKNDPAMSGKSKPELDALAKKKAGDVMCNFDTLVPKLIADRALNRLVYFREGDGISPKLAERLHNKFYGVVKPCRKNADIRLTIEAIQLANKVDTIIIMSGDSDYIELIQQLKSQGLRVEIAGVSSSTAKSLIEEADFFHAITEEDWFTFKN